MPRFEDKMTGLLEGCWPGGIQSRQTAIKDFRNVFRTQPFFRGYCHNVYTVILKQHLNQI